MLKIKIIPCLDVKDGRVVKGIRFADLRDAGDPVEAAIAYDAAGADELVFLDISATEEGRGALMDCVKATAERCFMPLTVGGGVRTLDDIRALLLAGADRIAINSAAVADPAFVGRAAERFGAQCIVVAIDAKAEGGAWKVFTHGGKRPSGRDAMEFVREAERRGAGEILLTSIDRDGSKAGYDLALVRAIAGAVRIPLIASGGAGSARHFVEAAEAGASAVLAASLFHFGELSLAGAKEALAAAGLPVRLTEQQGKRPHAG